MAVSLIGSPARVTSCESSSRIRSPTTICVSGRAVVAPDLRSRPRSRAMTSSSENGLVT